MSFNSKKYREYIKKILISHSEEDLTPKLVRSYLEKELNLDEGSLTKDKKKITELVKDIAAKLNNTDASEEEAPTKRKREKKVKDENKPKKACNSFNYFTAEYRKQLKDEHPEMSFAELSKECSKKWKEMSEEDKAPYTEKAAADKERFEKENEAYKEANPDVPQTKKSKKATKSTKSGPTKAKSAYQYFCTEQRPKIKEENPDADPPELMRLLGAAWKDLSEEDKAPYNEKAAIDKERYDEEMKEEKKNDPPSKPKTAYFIFSGEHRDEVKAENPSLSLTDVSKVLGEKWKALDDNEKAEYGKKAEKEKEEYNKKLAEWEAEHPDIVKANKEDAAGLTQYIKSQKSIGKTATACRKEWNNFSDDQKEKYKKLARDHNEGLEEKRAKRAEKKNKKEKKQEVEEEDGGVEEVEEVEDEEEEDEEEDEDPRKNSNEISIPKTEGSDGEYELED